MILQQKIAFPKELYAKNVLILSCFFDQNCCYILYSTKIEHKMKKCFHPTKQVAI